MVDVFDYEADKSQVKKEYNIDLLEEINEKYDGIILAVKHSDFKKLDIESLKIDETSVIYDLKGFFPKNLVNARL